MEMSTKKGGMEISNPSPRELEIFFVFAKICAGTIFVILKFKLCLSGNCFKGMYKMENIPQERSVPNFEEYI